MRETMADSKVNHTTMTTPSGNEVAAIVPLLLTIIHKPQIFKTLM
jgi:hypothetical protein